MNNNNQTLEIIINFLNAIHIKVLQKHLSHDTFLPGLQIKGSTLFFDREKLKYLGDMLHEAGHIAVAEEHTRALIGSKNNDNNWPPDSEEIAAILWSYAAACHLELDIEIVFHPNGYKNDSQWLIEQFKNKNYIGLPLLEWMSLCTTKEFPKMEKWLR